MSCLVSVNIPFGSGSADPNSWLTDRDPDPDLGAQSFLGAAGSGSRPPFFGY
jgi:hypothetical protein